MKCNLEILKYVILLLGVVLFQNCDSTNSVEQTVDEIETTTVNKKIDSTEVNHSLQQASDSVYQKLHRRALGFTSDLIPLSESKNYSNGVAQLTRQYSWNLAFPITFRTSDIKISPKPGTDKIAIKISRLTIGKRFSYGDKKATTIEKTNWENEESKDKAFWAQLDQLSHAKIKNAIDDKSELVNQIKNKAASVLLAEINKLTEGTDVAENEFEIVIGQILLK